MKASRIAGSSALLPEQPDAVILAMGPPPRHRRRAIKAGSLTLLAAAAGRAAVGKVPQAQRPRRILLRSSRQTVNIGDIAHTPGLLATLERELPEVEVTLWPSSLASDFPQNRPRFALHSDDRKIAPVPISHVRSLIDTERQ